MQSSILTLADDCCCPTSGKFSPQQQVRGTSAGGDILLAVILRANRENAEFMQLSMNRVA
eukprot:130624-Prorocentrum_minimum.AAC.2